MKLIEKEGGVVVELKVVFEVEALFAVSGSSLNGLSLSSGGGGGSSSSSYCYIIIKKIKKQIIRKIFFVKSENINH